MKIVRKTTHDVLVLSFVECVELLKELEHRKLAWKVLILKYDLGKSHKEMWCKMADTKIILTTYFKRWKVHVI